MGDSWKCSVRDGKFVEPCESLGRMIEGPAAFSKTKGLHVWNMRDIKTGKPTRTYFGFKNTGPKEYHKGGFLINFCPFCGTQIDAPFNSEEGENAPAQ